MTKAVWLGAVLGAGLALPVAAQESIDQVCEDVPAAYVGRCIAAVQAADAAHPQLGMLITGGNPGLGLAAGSAGPEGAPRLRATGRFNLVRLALPGITSERNTGEAPPPLTEETNVVGVSLGADLAFGLTPGIEVSPGTSVGVVDLLASATYLPVDLVSHELFDASSTRVAWGAGVRVGVLRETPRVPGVSLSVMYRSMGEVQFGNACEGTESPDQSPFAPPRTSLCNVDGDVAQARVGLTGWSTRATVSRKVLGVGLTLGAGYDRYADDFQVGVLGARGTPANRARVYRSPPAELESDRLSGFLGASYVLPRGTVVAEVGWMQGGERVTGFPAESDFDPAAGTVFASFGGRWTM
ncbi:MAG TPA: hypothetical protein VHG08_28955 [Longimicrobium sp.]|nr:hypothetical protein [Longimicrobium sp.]